MDGTARMDVRALQVLKVARQVSRTPILEARPRHDALGN